MRKTTILALNQLNQAFYKQVADEFDASRQFYWQGWGRLVPILDELVRKKSNEKSIFVLDVGCGNGRFGQFLAEFFLDASWDYLGVDVSPELLAKAKQNLADSLPHHTLKNIDLVTALLDSSLVKQLQQHRHAFDLVVVFGVLHHVPSFKLREQLVKQLADMMSPRSVLVATSWDFLKLPNIKNKLVEPPKAGFTRSELEENDYILDWQRGQSAYRYCHLVSEAETQHLFADYTQLLQFSADAKQSKANTYVVLQKKE